MWLSSLLLIFTQHGILLQLFVVLLYVSCEIAYKLASDIVISILNYSDFNCFGYSYALDDTFGILADLCVCNHCQHRPHCGFVVHIL